VSVVVGRRTVDRTNLHRLWKAVLIGIALIVVIACYFVPVVAVALGVLVLLLLCGRLVYPRRERYIPNLYAPCGAAATTSSRSSTTTPPTDPTEAINGRLEALRRNALGFRNLTHDRLRSLLHSGALHTLVNAP
jgi:hypothetical protein